MTTRISIQRISNVVRPSLAHYLCDYYRFVKVTIHCWLRHVFDEQPLLREPFIGGTGHLSGNLWLNILGGRIEWRQVNKDSMLKVESHTIFLWMKRVIFSVMKIVVYTCRPEHNFVFRSNVFITSSITYVLFSGDLLTAPYFTIDRVWRWSGRRSFNVSPFVFFFQFLSGLLCGHYVMVIGATFIWWFDVILPFMRQVYKVMYKVSLI